MHPEERTSTELEGPARQLGQPVLDLGIVPVRDILDQQPLLLAKGQFGHAEKAGRRPLLDDREHGPQRILSGDDLPECAPKRVEVELRVDQAGPRHVVGGSDRGKLMRIPEHLLPVRERLVELGAYRLRSLERPRFRGPAGRERQPIEVDSQGLPRHRPSWPGLGGSSPRATTKGETSRQGTTRPPSSGRQPSRNRAPSTSEAGRDQPSHDPFPGRQPPAPAILRATVDDCHRPEGRAGHWGHGRPSSSSATSGPPPEPGMS